LGRKEKTHGNTGRGGGGAKSFRNAKMKGKVLGSERERKHFRKLTHRWGKKNDRGSKNGKERKLKTPKKELHNSLHPPGNSERPSGDRTVLALREKRNSEECLKGEK